MDKKFYSTFETGIGLPVVLLSAFTIASLIVSKDIYLFIAQLGIILLYILFNALMKERKRRSIAKYMKSMVSKLDAAARESLIRFPLPLSVIGVSGEIIWYNEAFSEAVEKTVGVGALFGQDVTRIAKELDLSVLSKDKGTLCQEIAFGDKHYIVYGHTVRGETANATGEAMAMLYWVDNTELYDTRNEMEIKNAVIAIAVVDNYDEMLQNAREDERVAITAAVEERILQWAKTENILLKKIERDKYYLFLQERNLRSYIEEKFSILDGVKNIVVQSGKQQITLSIGIGRGCETIAECDEFARQALDMALGRGGDQVAIKDYKGFEFFGGRAQPVEKRTKVKARVMASAMTELIDNCSNILIMGHRFADWDSLGAAIGLTRIAKSKMKPVNIVLDISGSIEDEYIDKIKANPQYADVFIASERAHDLITEQTLLFIVDTHRPEYLESPSVYERCKTVIVLDHHKKGTDYITRAALFYHEPFASSCCEIISELMQYFDLTGQFLKIEAETMLAGIVLDTKNFSFRTGVRTFESAGFLRKCGADTIEVKRLFQSDHDAYIEKTKLVSKAEFYKEEMVIASSDDENIRNGKTLIAQAADDLLGISGVEASFVLYKSGDTVHLSARSLGATNVQIIVEKLGGGGHHTMAGAQLKELSLEEAENKLKAAIDEYIESLKK